MFGLCICYFSFLNDFYRVCLSSEWELPDLISNAFDILIRNEVKRDNFEFDLNYDTRRLHYILVFFKSWKSYKKVKLKSKKLQ